mmetsp:Transcript_3413/g.6036  ORF Transcript_3413/g.6036 Transcript_3413/m.6036 type:complete len:211 (-) Transcript_3413:114-746(-)
MLITNGTNVLFVLCMNARATTKITHGRVGCKTARLLFVVCLSRIVSFGFVPPKFHLYQVWRSVNQQAAPIVTMRASPRQDLVRAGLGALLEEFPTWLSTHNPITNICSAQSCSVMLPCLAPHQDLCFVIQHSSPRPKHGLALCDSTCGAETLDQPKLANQAPIRIYRITHNTHHNTRRPYPHFRDHDHSHAALCNSLAALFVQLVHRLSR